MGLDQQLTDCESYENEENAEEEAANGEVDETMIIVSSSSLDAVSKSTCHGVECIDRKSTCRNQVLRKAAVPGQERLPSRMRSE